MNKLILYFDHEDAEILKALQQSGCVVTVDKRSVRGLANEPTLVQAGLEFISDPKHLAAIGTLLASALLLYLGKGKRAYIKDGKKVVDLRNLNEASIIQIVERVFKEKK